MIGIPISHRQTSQRRGGYVLVLVAMLMFGLMAMAAVVIDLGFARLTQRQMQTAADTAALEGLRGEGMSSVAYSDRQDAAETLIAWTFDDNLDPSDGDSSSSGGDAAFGAGPLVSFSAGAVDPSLHASETMTVDANNRAYKPVVGRGTETPGEFRVHLQRGANDQDTNLYSNGPAVPYLFARGSRLDRQVIGNGITVRGESIARSLPAVRVGAPVGSLPGVVPVAFALADWGATPINPVIITSDVSQGLSIGASISVGAAATPPTTGYCVVYDSATLRVIGFGLLGQAVTVDGVVAQRNATASLSAASDSLAALSVAQRIDVVNANRTLTHALSSPVLVRN